MYRVDRSIEISVPVGTAYNQWTQFEEFPLFMAGIKEVRQLDANHLRWRQEIGGQESESIVEITRQIPDQRICWHGTSGMKNEGEVVFQWRGQFQSLVILRFDYEPKGMMDSSGDFMDRVRSQIRAWLHQFKEFIESRGSATGAWRGEIKDGQIREPVRHSPPSVGGVATETKIIAIGRDCPACGMPPRQWAKTGYSRAGTDYCCEGCATGTGCTCRSEQKAAA